MSFSVEDRDLIRTELHEDKLVKEFSLTAKKRGDTTLKMKIVKDGEVHNITVKFNNQRLKIESDNGTLRNGEQKQVISNYPTDNRDFIMLIREGIIREIDEDRNTIAEKIEDKFGV